MKKIYKLFSLGISNTFVGNNSLSIPKKEIDCTHFMKSFILAEFSIPYRIYVFWK
jgi:hypothetical protein